MGLLLLRLLGTEHATLLHKLLLRLVLLRLVLWGRLRLRTLLEERAALLLLLLRLRVCPLVDLVCPRETLLLSRACRSRRRGDGQSVE